MPPSLNVIALISGGKDSLFSILHCLANGHTVVALANLHPPASTTIDDDLNSYMYQTVGHTIIPLYEEALGIPLFRQEIRGSAVNSARDYSTQEDDETEDLVPLLRRVREAHPEANAVSTGAIFSTYQRTRVENVAVRLGLTPLSYLWQYPVLPPYLQSSLLSDMQVVGQDARIIKVASGGLDESFLWQNVADAKTVARMKKAIGRFSEVGDGALLGEGGEFETLAVDGPGVLWKKRIEVEDDGVVLQSGGTALWKGKNARVAEKSGDAAGGLEDLRRPPLFDDEFARILGSGLDVGENVFAMPEREPAFDSLPTNTQAMQGRVFTYSNVTGETVPGVASNPKSQLTNILLRLEHALQLHDIQREAITHITLLLRNMADFSEINSVYAKYFNYTNPPARVTVAVGDAMPSPFDVMLSVVAHKDLERSGLHVQSQSYWAPANIGPYSQAITVPMLPPAEDTQSDSDTVLNASREVHIAGQIPLHPASMELYTEDGFKGEAILALQHLWRIGRATGVRWWPAGVAFLPYTTDRTLQESRILLAQAIWKAMHETKEDDEEDADVIDAWDRKNLHATFTDRVTPSPIPHPDAFSPSLEENFPAYPPCFVVEVESLPRNAAIEWSCTGVTAQSGHTSSDDSPPKRTYTKPVHLRSPLTYATIETTGGMLSLQLRSQFTNGTAYVADAGVVEDQSGT